MSSTSFVQKKIKILDQLAVPDEQYSDLSPKGSIDKGIRNLVDRINEIDGLVTTSSCAGRVSVFQEGLKKHQLSTDDEHGEHGAIAGPGGKGGGRWLFVSHDPVSIPSHSSILKDTFGLGTAKPSENRTAVGPRSSLIHFKFEAMILHVMTASPNDAQAVLSVAQQSGFRESGIMRLGESPMVAVRSSGLSLDSIIAYRDDDGSLSMVVDGEYLMLTAQTSNARFAVNADRIRRFEAALLKRFATTTIHDASDEPWEDAIVRRERKRREGLLRQQQLRHEQQFKDQPPLM